MLKILKKISVLRRELSRERIFREETAAKAAETALKQCYPQTYLAKPVGKLV